MVGHLAKACGTEKITVLFRQKTDLVSNIYKRSSVQVDQTVQ